MERLSDLNQRLQILKLTIKTNAELFELLAKLTAELKSEILTDAEFMCLDFEHYLVIEELESRNVNI